MGIAASRRVGTRVASRNVKISHLTPVQQQVARIQVPRRVCRIRARVRPHPQGRTTLSAAPWKEMG